MFAMHTAHPGGVTWGIERGSSRVVDMDSRGTEGEIVRVIRNVNIGVKLLEEKVGDECWERRRADVKSELFDCPWVPWLCGTVKYLCISKHL